MKIINNINLLNSPIQLKSNNIYKNKSVSDNKPINNKELLTVPYNINYATFTFKMNQRANILLKNSDKTMAELSENEKNKLSHRAKALEKVLEYINKKSICI